MGSAFSSSAFSRDGIRSRRWFWPPFIRFSASGSLRSVPNYLILSRLGLLDILLTILLPAVLTAALAAAGWFALDRLLRSDFAHLTQPCAAGEPKKEETL